jgi:hypothetical protein
MDLPTELRLKILKLFLVPFLHDYDPWFHPPTQQRGLLHISIHQREPPINDNLGHPRSYTMLLEGYVGWAKEEALPHFQDLRSISHASRELRREIVELCWGNFLLEIATLHFLEHRRDERPINIYFNLRIGELPRTQEDSSYPVDDRGADSQAYTVGVMDLLDCLRYIPIRSFNLWITMTIEGAEGLLEGQHSIPWITAFRALRVQQAMSFRVSPPDGYNAMRKKRVLALVLSILMADTIRTEASTQYEQAVSHAERGICDGIEPWVVEELKDFDVEKPYWSEWTPK